MLVLSRRSAPTAFLRTKRPGVRGSPPPGISTPGNPHFRGVCETRRNRHPHVGPPTRANLGPGPPLEIIATFISPPGTLPPPRARIGGVGRQGGKGGNRLAERHGSRRGNGQPPPLSAWRSRGTGPGQGPRSWAGGRGPNHDSPPGPVRQFVFSLSIGVSTGTDAMDASTEFVAD